MPISHLFVGSHSYLDCDQSYLDWIFRVTWTGLHAYRKCRNWTSSMDETTFLSGHESLVYFSYLQYLTTTNPLKASDFLTDDLSSQVRCNCCSIVCVNAWRRVDTHTYIATFISALLGWRSFSLRYCTPLDKRLVGSIPPELRVRCLDAAAPNAPLPLFHPSPPMHIVKLIRYISEGILYFGCLKRKVYLLRDQLASGEGLERSYPAHTRLVICDCAIENYLHWRRDVTDAAKTTPRCELDVLQKSSLPSITRGFLWWISCASPMFPIKWAFVRLIRLRLFASYFSSSYFRKAVAGTCNYSTESRASGKMDSGAAGMTI